MDYDKMIEKYGIDFLQENYPEDVPFEMGMLSEIIGDEDIIDTLLRARNGYEWPNNRDAFNPTSDYFVINAYGNFVSIKDYDYDDYVESVISENEFIKWVEENYGELE